MDLIMFEDVILVTLPLGTQIPVSRLRERDLKQTLLRCLKKGCRNPTGFRL